MTRLERVLYRRRTMLFVMAAILFLGGAVGVAFLQIRAESHRADQLATEADLRGTAVSTLAGDVRALRAQVQSEGKTPVAPDPSKAVPSLPDRTEVPVPIPGPKGDKGDQGAPGAAGSPAPVITPSPGATGAAGAQGAPGKDGANGQDGLPGKDGQDGAPGKDGTNGVDGRDGAAGQPPAGWTWTDPSGQSYACSPVDGFDPAAPRYACTADATATPPPTDSTNTSGILGVGMLAATATYRKL